MSSDSTNTSLKGKRKKKIPPNANPLFTQWLTEWKQEAAEKGWKSSHTYAKALKTLKVFPLTLASGKDCKLLQNFGEKICKMLDERLAEYKLAQGKSTVDTNGYTNAYHISNKDSESVPSQYEITSNKNTSRKRNNKDQFQDKNSACSVAPSISSCSRVPLVTDTASSLQTEFSVVSNRPTAKPSGQTAYSANAPSNGTKKSNTIGLHVISESDDSDNDLEVISPPQKKKLKAKGNQCREYVPAYRSGPYALILAFYRYMQDAEFRGYLTKSELSHAAQPLADKSFTVPDPGSRYTAWSSMGTLIKKGFILKTSSPARYTLTDEGYQLGQRLNAAEMQDNGTIDISYQRSRSADASHSAGLSTIHNLQGRSRDRRNSETNNQLRFRTSELLGHLQQQKLSSDSEDGDLSIAITESLLGYSKEETNNYQSSAPFIPTSISGNTGQTVQLAEQLPEHNATKSGQTRLCSYSHDDSFSSLPSIPSITHDNEDAILIMSDDDGESNVLERVLPNRTWAQYHSLSPSTTPPLTHPLKLSSSKLSVSTEPMSQKSASSTISKSISPSPDIEHIQKEINSTTNRSPQCIQYSASIFQQNVMEISDTSDDETNKVLSLKHGDIAKKYDASDDDELPDLILPLSKRLIQRGFAETGLLRSLASSFVPQTSEPQNSLSVTVKEPSYQGNNFTNLNAKSSDHITGMSASMMPASTASYTSHRSHISHSSDHVHKSHSTSATNKQDFDSIDTISVFQKDTRVVNTDDNIGKNSKLLQMGQDLSAPYVPTSSATVESVGNHCPTFTFQPGSFDIILCLDNREFYGSKGSSKTLLPELMKSGIQCDLRLLHVGDLLWIARERVGLHTERRGKELVLHYIIERKRMDDLVSSMTDGRLKEQKFRLKHCGLSDPIILIEEYGSIQNFSISEDRIKQSIVNSQIIDGFRVKRCGSANEVVTYLATMTRFLSQYYSTKTLHEVSLDHIKLLKGQQTIQNKEHYLIPFDVFNEASVKHKDLTVKEMFAKQLIQVPGVSADRARAITNVYPSFSILMSAYDNCTNDKDKQRLLSGIKCGKKERNLGIALSQLLCMLYTQKGALF